MSQDARAKLHTLIDAYYDNADGAYDDHTLDVVIQREGLSEPIANAIDLEIVELAADWDGRTDGVHGLVKPNAVYINGQRVNGPLKQDFSINASPDFSDLVSVTMTLFVRDLTVRKRNKPMTRQEREDHRKLVASVVDKLNEAK